MPVEDHAVHEMTRFDDTKRYGCHNRGAYAGAYMAHPWAATGGKWAEYRMSRECRFDMSLRDPWCEGCKHRGSGEAYDAKVRAAAA